MDNKINNDFAKEIKMAVENPDHILSDCGHHSFYVKGTLLVYALKSAVIDNRYDIQCAGYLKKVDKKENVNG